MKQAKEKKAILKAVSIGPEKVRISFADTGYGIRKELLPIILAPFTTTKASSEGTGMGLYNAKRMVEKYKGRIWTESEGGGGDVLLKLKSGCSIPSQCYNMYQDS